MNLSLRVALFALAFCGTAAAQTSKSDAPVAADPRLKITRFAVSPDIVHPIALDFDSKGRLLVIESHTHFPPPNYKGPKTDRIRMIEDTDGDGIADRFTTFFEGTTATMDLAVHPDGSVYISTRNEILRLRDTDGDGVANEKTRIAFLDTKGNYPHNGLSGMCFDSRGNLCFGLGENIGEKYRLTGADGTVLAGGGEGGNYFTCTRDGNKLRRIATGFWNPFGSCRDVFGRTWIVDNDPDSSPPCRLVQGIEGGDYGFQFRYGRAGRHPFQAWNGELPGTLPMVSGTGESPCEVISYESDGLPAEYRGDLLVPAWADHRVERYTPIAQGAGFTAERKPFVQGGKEFRPSGLAVAPDGSLFVADWVSQSYQLHGLGAIWHIQWKDAKSPSRPTEAAKGLFSFDRKTRERSARKLAADADGKAILRKALQNPEPRIRAAALTALIDSNDTQFELSSIARQDKEVGIRVMAVRELVTRGGDVSAFVHDPAAEVRASAIAGISGDKARQQLLELFSDADPYLRHAAVQRMAALPGVLAKIEFSLPANNPKQRIGLLLAHRASGAKGATTVLDKAIVDADPEVRLMALKWIADEALTKYREAVVAAMKSPSLDTRSYLAAATALSRIEDKPVNEDSLSGYFLERLNDKSAPASARLQALRAIPANFAKLKTESLIELLGGNDRTLQMEVLRMMKERGDAKAAAAIAEIARSAKQPATLRAQALVAWSAMQQIDADFLLELAVADDAALRQEAVRALIGSNLSDQQKEKLTKAAAVHSDIADGVARLEGKPIHTNRPGAGDLDTWLKRTEGEADADSGRRVFEHARLANCARCHRIDGRGANAGPDLSLIGRAGRRWILESLLQPSNSVAPHYQTWKIETADGRSLTGMLVHTQLDESTYIDPKGERFKLLAKDIAEVKAVKTSIMPDGLLDQLTDREIRDLVAYLSSRQ